MARLAKSLIVLRQEVNALAPNRSKVSDGWIGDPAHAARASRHNPNAEDVVAALDITHDPANGCDIHWIVRLMVAELRAGTWTGNPDIEYVISNVQTASRSNGWVWVRYTGDNPHRAHAHIAVGRGPDKAPRPPYDDTIPWGIAALLNNPESEDDELMAAKDEIISAITAEVRARTNDLVFAIERAANNVVLNIKGTVKELAKLQGIDFDEDELEAAVKAGVNAAFAEAFKAPK